MHKSILLTIFGFLLAAGPAWATDGIAGRFGVTVKAGVLVPLRSQLIETTSDTDNSLAYGGGLIYGLTRHLAGEVDITHGPSLKIKQSGLKVGEAAVTEISLGVQYRLTPDNRLVPYLGAGVDVIKGELANNGGERFDLGWTYGGHVNAGIDFFLTKGVAFTVDLRGLYAARGDVGSTGLDYDPTSFVGTIGFRLFLPEHLFL